MEKPPEKPWGEGPAEDESPIGVGRDEGNFAGSSTAHPRKREPAINLPVPLLAILGLLVALFVLDAYVLSDEMRAYFLFELAFTPLRYEFPLSAQGLEWLWTPVTYSFLHGSIEHLAFNSLWLAAFGAPVYRRIGLNRFVVFWALSAACSAFFHAALNWGQETILIGASGVVSALMGAACRFAFPVNGSGMFRTEVHHLPRQGIIGAMRNRTVFIFTLLWFLGNVMVAIGVPLVGGGDAQIAWDAHIGGFLFGYLLFGLFDPLPNTKA